MNNFSSTVEVGILSVYQEDKDGFVNCTSYMVETSRGIIYFPIEMEEPEPRDQEKIFSFIFTFSFPTFN